MENLCAYHSIPTPKSLRSIPYMGRKAKIFRALLHLEHTFYLHLEITFINYIYSLPPHASCALLRALHFIYIYKLHLYLLFPFAHPIALWSAPLFYPLLHHTFINYTYNSTCSSTCKFFWLA